MMRSIGLLFVVVALAGCAAKKQVETLRMPTNIVRAVNGVCTCAGETWSCPSLALPDTEVTRWDAKARARNKLALEWGNTPEPMMDRCLVTPRSWVWIEEKP